MVRSWPRKAANQSVYCAVLRSHSWVGLIKRELKRRQEGDGYPGGVRRRIRNVLGEG